MKNVLCWDPGAVRQVINPFAEHMPDSMFRAVHTDWDLMVSPPVGKAFQEVQAAAFTSMSPPTFLADFLRDDRPHALAAILGETGSGKSHLVHWMRLHVTTTPERLVLIVRKSGTSLREIVRMIIGELPADERQGFYDTLNASGEGTATRSGQKQQLLNDLAQTIRDEILPIEAGEVETELARTLPDLFQDPHMRDAHFFADDSVIAEIVDHIFATSNAHDRPDKRRSFQASDLPIGGSDYLHASKQARDAIQIIDLDVETHRALAVDIINRNLDRAVARTLSFTGDRVEELMTRLRSHLKIKGMELVLLIEEFARLQGIDRALLQAMTSHGDERLCKIRSAIAVTTGFFESVAETAYMRTTHIVDMNRSAGRDGHKSVTATSLSAFTVRYLNAARLGASAVEGWAQTAAPQDQAPSACDVCPHKPICHDAFGEVDGYGLYPFTAKALMIGAARVDANMPTSINPRILQNDLLVEVLDNQAGSIALGQYPRPVLLTKLGSDQDMRLPLQARAQLKTVSPANADRWITALELYDGSGAVVALPAGLRDAFDITEIPGAQTINASPSPVTLPVETEPTSAGGPAVNRQDILIESWINGGLLDQTIASQLRNLIYTAVAESVDWDMLGLAKALHTGQRRAFQVASVSFDRQATQSPEHMQVKLRIPGNHTDPATTGFALQGLLKASKADFNWDFPGGDKALPAFLECMSLWTADVERQLSALRTPAPGWTPAVAALELLCVTSAINGKLRTDATIADMVDAAFAPPPSECQSTAPAMVSLYDKLRAQREKMVGVARGALSSQKGGRAGAMLDPSRFIGAIRALRQGKWRLAQTPPASDQSDVARLYREVQTALPLAAEAEWAIRMDWLNQVVEGFGQDAKRAVIVAKLGEARQAAIDVGLNSHNSAKPLGDALSLFENVLFDDTLTAFRSMAKQEDALAALAFYGRGRRAAVTQTLTLLQSAKLFLDAIDKNFDSYGEEHQAKHDAIVSSVDQIEQDLGLIASSLTALTQTSETQNVA